MSSSQYSLSAFFTTERTLIGYTIPRLTDWSKLDVRAFKFHISKMQQHSKITVPRLMCIQWLVCSDHFKKVQCFSSSVQSVGRRPLRKLSCQGNDITRSQTALSFIRSLIFGTVRVRKHSHWKTVGTFFAQCYLCSTVFVIPDASFFVFFSATYLSGASHWGMMRVRARCAAGLHFPFDWCSFRVSRGDECCNTAVKSQTFLGTFQQFFSHPTAIFKPLPVFKVLLWGVACCHGTPSPLGLNRHMWSLIMSDFIIWPRLSHLCNRCWIILCLCLLYHVSFMDSLSYTLVKHKQV